jgi:hypothetical protein
MTTPNDSQPKPDATPLITATAPSTAPGAPEPAKSEIAPSEAQKIDAPEIELPKMPRADAFKPTFRPRSAIAATAAKPDVSSARPRLALLAASITIAAALGTAAGALAGAALTRQASEQPDTNNLRGVVAQLSSEIIALKAAIETSSKNANAQFAKIAERAEKAQAEPAARLARLAEAVDRLEKKPSAIAAVADITGSIVEKQDQRPPILEGWILRDIFNGRAMVEGRSGLYEVGPGSTLPGIGRVEAVKRQDGRWVVVTGKGLIVSSR